MTSSYSAKLVEGLKMVIPSGDRSFDPQSKNWFFKENYGEMIRKIAEAALGPGTVSFVSKQVAEQQRQAYQSQRPPSLSTNAQSIDSALVQFVGLLTYDACKRAYLITAQSLHPDKQGGDTQKMAQLNEVWQRIEREVFKR
jgi:hypothetical protein